MYATVASNACMFILVYSRSSGPSTYMVLPAAVICPVFHIRFFILYIAYNNYIADRNHFNKIIYLARYHNDVQTVTAMKVSPDINTQPVNCPLKDIPRNAEHILLFNGINHYWKVMPTELFEVDNDDDVKNDTATSTANSFFNKRQTDIKQFEKDFPQLTDAKKLGTLTPSRWGLVLLTLLLLTAQMYR